MEDFFQLFGYITATFIIGFYIKRLRTIKYNLKKKDYNEINDDEKEDDNASKIVEESIIHENIKDTHVSDISSSNSDKEFIIINEV